jgi:hypothetical protein
VSHVAPNTNVKMKIMEAAAAPYCEAFPGSVLSIPRRDIPPARNIATPWPTEPQYNVHLLPIRSSVNTQMRVENFRVLLASLFKWKEEMPDIPCRICCSVRISTATFGYQIQRCGNGGSI